MSRSASLNPKDWKVIYTIIGGCPATVTQVNGNLNSNGTYNRFATAKACTIANSEETNCMKVYDIRIPSELASGEYVFAWTWVGFSCFRLWVIANINSSIKSETERCI